MVWVVFLVQYIHLSRLTILLRRLYNVFFILTSILRICSSNIYNVGQEGRVSLNFIHRCVIVHCTWETKWMLFPISYSCSTGNYITYSGKLTNTGYNKFW